MGACCERNLNNSLQNPTSEHGSYRQKTLMELYTSCIHVHDTMSVHNRERAKQMRWCYVDSACTYRGGVSADLRNRIVYSHCGSSNAFVLDIFAQDMTHKRALCWELWFGRINTQDAAIFCLTSQSSAPVRWLSYVNRRVDTETTPPMGSPPQESRNLSTGLWYYLLDPNIELHLTIVQVV